MKTPITYYGGKQMMLKHILPIIPKHTIYVEPFLGGGAVFWAKEPSSVEVINDTNAEIVNFYEIAQKNFSALQKEIQATLHSRKRHSQARVVYENADMFTPVKRAWAFWTLANQSFSSILTGGWGYGNDVSVPRRLTSKKNNFTKELSERLENVQVECNNALQIIKVRDSENTFFYLDPPYINSDMGHYAGYSQQDFKDLLGILSKIKGKFLLSSYPSEMLSTYTRVHGWHTFSIDKKIAVTKHTNKTKTEVLTANYEIHHTIKSAA
ncbi:MAG TPA: DNA adenine methylase [Bacteroidia bacterium]|jgi:DNA adenine methylase|nr:DNA adenine methylase [Bacteroidia bacterium]